MKDKILDFIDEHNIAVMLGIIALIIGTVAALIIASYNYDKKIWNNGFCSCGGKWEYVDSQSKVHGTDGNIWTSTSYIYKCNRCGSRHEFEQLR